MGSAISLIWPQNGHVTIVVLIIPFFLQNFVDVFA